MLGFHAETKLLLAKKFARSMQHVDETFIYIGITLGVDI